VHSTADADASMCGWPMRGLHRPRRQRSYLNVPALLAAAKSPAPTRWHPQRLSVGKTPACQNPADQQLHLSAKAKHIRLMGDRSSQETRKARIPVCRLRRGVGLTTTDGDRASHRFFRAGEGASGWRRAGMKVAQTPTT